MMTMEEKILDVLEKDGSLTTDQIAVMLGIYAGEVERIIDDLTARGIILGRKTIINWEKIERPTVTAHIELRITPERGEGFDKIAERIYQYPEIKALYLMSGSYDLGVIIDGASMREIALFVAEKLAPMEHVVSTTTHFVLRRYKEDGVILGIDRVDERAVITL